MKRNIILSMFWVTLSATSGCMVYDFISPPPFLLLENHRHFPKRPKFSILPSDIRNDAGIDFNAVYFLSNSDLGGRLDLNGNYYRFWPNGRVGITFTRSNGPPSAVEADEFRSALIGYYKLDRDHLTMELYAPSPGNPWSHRLGHGVFDSDGNFVETLSEQYDPLKKSNRVYVRLPIKDLKFAPDW